MATYKRKLVPFVLGIAVLLQGCVAATPLLIAGMYAVTAFEVYKHVQLTTGGSVEIGFNEEALEVDRIALREIQRPGVWPENEGEVQLASTLESSGVFDDVITPTEVTRVISEMQIGQNVSLLTDSELRESLRQVCDETGADAVIASKTLGTDTSTNFFSLNRANSVTRAEVFVYSRHRDQIILSTQIELKINVGPNGADLQEAVRVGGEAIAEKILELRG